MIARNLSISGEKLSTFPGLVLPNTNWALTIPETNRARELVSRDTSSVLVGDAMDAFTAVSTKSRPRSTRWVSKFEMKLLPWPVSNLIGNRPKTSLHCISRGKDPPSAFLFKRTYKIRPHQGHLLLRYWQRSTCRVTIGHHPGRPSQPARVPILDRVWLNRPTNFCTHCGDVSHLRENLPRRKDLVYLALLWIL